MTATAHVRWCVVYVKGDPSDPLAQRPHVLRSRLVHGGQVPLTGCGRAVDARGRAVPFDPTSPAACAECRRFVTERP